MNMNKNNNIQEKKTREREEEENKTLISELKSATPLIKDVMKKLGGLNDSEIDKEFKKIDKQLNRRDIYFNAYHDSTKKPEYNDAEYLLNGINVGKLINVYGRQGGDGSMDYIFDFTFEKGKSIENVHKRSNDIITPLI